MRFVNIVRIFLIIEFNNYTMPKREKYLTLAEAEAQGYSTVNAIKKQILRGVIKAKKIGPIWIVHTNELDLMLQRKAEWLAKRKKKGHTT